MKDILKQIIQCSGLGERLLAVLIDPDKIEVSEVSDLMEAINKSMVTHVLVGGSEVEPQQMELITSAIKKQTQLPVVLFPGAVEQITEAADALLFLSLLSGRNPDYLIGKQVEAVKYLRGSELEIIPTGYLLIENGKQTAVQRVSGTEPIPRKNIEIIVDTAKAGELLGMKLIYLEAGSGALHPISEAIINHVKKELDIPLIVGGGIKTQDQLEAAYAAGANMVVIGTAFETNTEFFSSIKKNTVEKLMSSN